MNTPKRALRGSKEPRVPHVGGLSAEQLRSLEDLKRHTGWPVLKAILDSAGLSARQDFSNPLLALGERQTGILVGRAACCEWIVGIPDDADEQLRRDTSNEDGTS